MRDVHHSNGVYSIFLCRFVLFASTWVATTKAACCDAHWISFDCSESEPTFPNTRCILYALLVVYLVTLSAKTHLTNRPSDRNWFATHVTHSDSIIKSSYEFGTFQAVFSLSSFHISCDDDFKYDLYSDQVGVQTSYILKLGKFFGMFHCTITITTTTRFGECSGYILYTTFISFRPVTT